MDIRGDFSSSGTRVVWGRTNYPGNKLHGYPGTRGSQCRINGGARGAAAPGPAVLGARNWWEWKIFMCCYTSVRGLYLAQHPAPH